jgi:2-polyprenyl-6-methoxyphenol hydroxylase-like FAD-dependent oxidoreductase
MMARPRALVIGGSLGGLFAAHLLRQIGWDAVVFERIADDLSSRGVGIGTHDALGEIMHRLGLPFDDGMGVAVRSCICLDRAGRVTHDMPIHRIMSAWSRFYTPLKAALPPECYRAGRALVGVEQDEAGVTAIFADGARETGDLLVAADGIRSTVREALAPGAQPAYAGYVAWRAVAEERALPASFAPIFASYSFCLPDGEMVLAYPVPGQGGDTRPGRRGYNLVWYRPVEFGRELARLCTDASGHCHGTSIPPPLIRPDVLAEVRDAARALLAPALAEIVLTTEQLFFQPIYDLETPRMVFGRIALMGDAAFVARPHVGAGVTKAALDAACLADALAVAGDLAPALARYDEQQRIFGSAIVARGRTLGASLSARDTAPREPLAIMREHSAKIKFMRQETAGQSSGWLKPDRRFDYYYD